MKRVVMELSVLVDGGGGLSAPYQVDERNLGHHLADGSKNNFKRLSYNEPELEEEDFHFNGHELQEF